MLFVGSSKGRRSGMRTDCTQWYDICKRREREGVRGGGTHIIPTSGYFLRPEKNPRCLIKREVHKEHVRGLLFWAAPLPPLWSVAVALNLAANATKSFCCWPLRLLPRVCVCVSTKLPLLECGRKIPPSPETPSWVGKRLGRQERRWDRFHFNVLLNVLTVPFRRFPTMWPPYLWKWKMADVSLTLNLFGFSTWIFH